MPARKQKVPIESSWRVVEGGEDDSFDTTVLPDEELVLSSDPSQLPTQMSGSQPFSFTGSQDDQLERFTDRAEKDEMIIMRSPFRSSIPKSVRQASRDNMKHRSPEPEFRYPSVDVDDTRRGTSTRASSSRTLKPSASSDMTVRRRQPNTTGNRTRATQQRSEEDADDRPTRGFGACLGQSLPDALFNTLAWGFGVIGLAFRYAQKPLAIALAVYFVFGGLIIAQNMVTKSIYASLSPICRIPGVSYLDLPFCPALIPQDGSSPTQSVEFDGLMDVQERFEEVLEKSAQGVSLPLEMKRSELKVRDLRTTVKYSALQTKEELVLEFDGYIDAARTATNDIQRFNTRVGSAVDHVISVNRYTARYLDSLANEKDEQGLIGAWAGWAFAPFQPATFNERMLLDQYVEHTALVSDMIAKLILEAQAVLRTLSVAEDHLGTIFDFVTRTEKNVQGRKDEMLWSLGTYFGGKFKHLHNLNTQMGLLAKVDQQRAGAVRQISDLILDLENIQAGLSDLRDRVAAPEIVRGGVARIPLSVHIETIDKGVERLETARNRIRAVENERFNAVLARTEVKPPLIGPS